MENKEGYWERVDREAVVRAIDLVDEAAKELVGIMTLLQGIYFAAVSLGDLKSTVPAWALPLLVAPIPFWLAGLIFAMRAFVPKTYHRTAGEEVPQLYQRILEGKRRDLRWAHGLLLISLVFPLLSILVYLTTVASSVQTP